jgi:hypothetical protein
MFNCPGSKLIGFSGFRVFLIINNILFVHSGLQDKFKDVTYNYLVKLNKKINESVTTDYDLLHKELDSYKKISSFINDRAQSDYNSFYDRHKNRFEVPIEISDEERKSYRDMLEYTREKEATNFCEETDKKLTDFCYSTPERRKLNILVVGHVVQSDVVMERLPVNITLFHDAVRSGNVIEYFSPFQEMSVIDTDRIRESDINLVPGSVNVECIHDTNYASIYKIDVSMSKAFDINPKIASKLYEHHFTSIFSDDPDIHDFDTFMKNKIMENGIKSYNKRENYRTTYENRTNGVEIDEYVMSLMRSRCPTVLHIKFEPTEVISVIRSSLKNTLIHQPRGDSFDYPEWLVQDFLDTTRYANSEMY